MPKLSIDRKRFLKTMSLIPAVRHQIESREDGDPIRIALQFLLDQNAVGRSNAVSISTVTTHLNDRGINLEYRHVQQQIMGASRHGDFFIGSNSRGIFLIDTIEDAREARDFYQTKIQSMQQNLDHLIAVSNRVGWDLTEGE